MKFNQSTYKNFIQLCEVLFPHTDCLLVSAAYKLAALEHGEQVRKDERGPDGEPVPYMDHVVRTALILLDEIGIAVVTAIIVALFHDAVEDTDLSPEEITLLFGVEVGKRVMLVSKKPKANFLRRLRQHGDWITFAVKVADRVDNLRHMSNSSDEFRAKQVRETREEYYDLADRMCQGSPSEYNYAADDLRTLLRTECERVARGEDRKQEPLHPVSIA